jgi:hypothetical protein
MSAELLHSSEDLPKNGGEPFLKNPSHGTPDLQYLLRMQQTMPQDMETILQPLDLNNS